MHALTATLAATVILGVSLSARSDQSDITAFQNATQKAWVLCSWRATIAGTIFGDDAHFDETDACVTSALVEAKALFVPAIGSSLTEGGKAAMKSYYAKWISSIRSLPSMQHSSKSEIERSKSQADRELAEAWAMVEIEAQ